MKDKLISDTILTCIENGINVKLFSKRTHQGCKGSLEEDNFIVCTRLPEHDWLGVFVHESCHLDQLVEKDSMWYDDPNKNSDLIWDGSQKEKHPRKYLNGFKYMTKLEIDCDERSVEKIEKYNLNIDIPDYIARANIYHWSYYYFHKYKCFYNPRKVPYLDDELLEALQMPDDQILGFDEVWKPNKVLGDYIQRYNVSL